MPKDLKLTDDFDLDFSASGDLKVFESTQQHKRCLVVANKGDYRQSPWVGVGVETFLNDDSFGDIQNEIQKQFELDGIQVNDLRIDVDGTITENGSYEEN